MAMNLAIRSPGITTGKLSFSFCNFSCRFRFGIGSGVMIIFLFLVGQ
ncbi:hypothetical protein HanXRQr2_Chr09g0395671 [Helianthus annuus]|uniref:Uncharacterized protein n=1 Tax=Helianthus annuus TaxID=4232 RepID=A0A9K3I7U9_HELAN|nr:hypothetical protein HanXRQr2_Chr09g0395671 [Helianthus annuus]KAJ0893759.1 hypothetical protein HanPSC8_Chr09g0381441 [Helianthus annuus]